MASRVSELYLKGTYKLNKRNPSYFDSFGKHTDSLLYVHSEVDQRALKIAFQPLISDLRNVAGLLAVDLSGVEIEQFFGMQLIEISKRFQKAFQNC